MKSQDSIQNIQALLTNKPAQCDSNYLKILKACVKNYNEEVDPDIGGSPEDERLIQSAKSVIAQQEKAQQKNDSQMNAKDQSKDKEMNELKKEIVEVKREYDVLKKALEIVSLSRK